MLHRRTVEQLRNSPRFFGDWNRLLFVLLRLWWFADILFSRAELRGQLGDLRQQVVDCCVEGISLEGDGRWLDGTGFVLQFGQVAVVSELGEFLAGQHSVQGTRGRVLKVRFSTQAIHDR